MKLLTNEYDYRMWFINEYLKADTLILSPDEIEIAIQAEMPEELPCMVLLTPSENLYGSGSIQYYYRKDIIRIGESLGLSVR